MSKKPSMIFYINSKNIENNFKEVSKFGNVFYPLKTNSNAEIIKILKSLITSNGGFLLSSLCHFYALKKQKISPEKMAFINVCAEQKTLKKLYQNGVRFFAFDNFECLEKFANYADKKTTKICVRISVCDVFDCEFSHLGANLTQATKMLKFLKNNGFLYGISFYLHKKLKFLNNSLQIMLDYILNNFKDYGIKFINIGGIFENTVGFFDKILDIKKQLEIAEINIEPGTKLLDGCVDLSSQILTKKRQDFGISLVVKNGIYSGFFDSVLYGKKYDVFLDFDGELVELKKCKNKGCLCVKIFGPTADSDDFVGDYYIDENFADKVLSANYILVKNCGAYFEELFCAYCQDNQKKYIITK